MHPISVLRLLLVTNIWLLVKANLDLFINHEEAHRLLGLKTTVYYFQRGEINHYATGFNITIPVNITELNFAWIGDNSTQIPYRILAETSNSEILLSPKLNISQHGLVPSQVQYWSVSAVCTGRTTSEVFLILKINVTLPRDKHPTTLILRRIKICHKGEIIQESSFQSEIPVPENNQIALIIAGNIFGSVLIVVTLAVVYYWRSKKVNQQVPNHREDCSSICHSSNNGQTFVPDSGRSSQQHTKSGSYSSLKMFSDNPSSDKLSSINGKKELDELLAELVVDPKDVTVKSQIAKGKYGKVFEGVLQSTPSELFEDILIKTVSNRATKTQVVELLRSGLQLYGVCHDNVHSVIGVCVGDAVPVIVYPAFGMNLKMYLLRQMSIGSLLTTQELLSMCCDLCAGLQYLHLKSYLHGDIASRNCRIDSLHNVKIADSALSCDLFPDDYVSLGLNRVLPVGWSSTELLEGHGKSFYSDIWAFGVLMWELVTLGHTPYHEIQVEMILPYLRKGYRLVQPVNCPDELFSMMAYCWTASPLERPLASQLYASLKAFENKLHSFI